MTTESMKPYPAYKDSGIEWIGEIPEGWKMLALKRIASLKSGESITSGRIDKDGEYPVFGGNGLRGYTTTFTHDGHYVLIGRQGALCGNVNYAQGQFWASEHAVVVSPIGLVETKWLGELLRAMNLNQYSVSAAQPGLSVEMVSNLSIPQPPLQEQSIIAIFLDNQTTKIDTLIENKQKQIELLKEERTAIINQVVTKGLNLDVPMRDSGIEWLGEIPEHWEIIHVKHLSKNESDVVQTGPFGAQLHSSDYIDEGIPLILIRNVNNLWIDDLDIPKVSEEDAKRLQIYRLKIGDIVFSRVGSIGRVALVGEREEGWMISGQMLRIRFNNPNIHEVFALYAFSSDVVVEFVKFKSVGSTRDSINTDILRNVPMTLPPLNEQYEIASYIKNESLKIDNTISQIQKQITLLQEYRTALISDAVTGKIDLRNQHEFPTPQ